MPPGSSPCSIPARDVVPVLMCLWLQLYSDIDGFAEAQLLRHLCVWHYLKKLFCGCFWWQIVANIPVRPDRIRRKSQIEFVCQDFAGASARRQTSGLFFPLRRSFRIQFLPPYPDSWSLIAVSGADSSRAVNDTFERCPECRWARRVSLGTDSADGFIRPGHRGGIANSVIAGSPISRLNAFGRDHIIGAILKHQIATRRGVKVSSSRSNFSIGRLKAASSNVVMSRAARTIIVYL